MSEEKKLRYVLQALMTLCTFLLVQGLPLHDNLKFLLVMILPQTVLLLIYYIIELTSNL